MSDFLSKLRRYRVDELIRYLSEISIKMSKNNESYIQIPLKYRSYIGMDTAVIGFAVWDSLEMQYQLIRCSNDHRNEVIKSEQEFAALVNQFRNFIDENQANEYLKDSSLEEIYKFMFGITNEQFLYQHRGWLLSAFNRNYHIIMKNREELKDKGIDIDTIIMETIGITSSQYFSILLIIFWLTTQYPEPLTAPEELYKKKTETVLTYDNIFRFIDYYSCDYECVRNSPIGKQIFYSKPFVRTDRGNRYIMSNKFCTDMLLSNGLYWVIRNYYNDKKSQTFLNEFGVLFEKYFDDLANRFLHYGQWEKIKEDYEKKADYKIEFENAIIIIEMKSALLGIEGKQQNPNFEQIDKFFKKTIMESIEQINKTAESINTEKPIVKIILLYDNLFNLQLLETAMPEIFKNDELLWVATIADLEFLLCTYKNNKELALEAIDKLLIPRCDFSSEYGSVLDIIDKLKLYENKPFEGELDYWTIAMKELGKELK